MRKRGMETRTLAMLLFGVLVLVIVIVAILILKDKGISFIDFISGLF